jgi:hypothetical protein
VVAWVVIGVAAVVVVTIVLARFHHSTVPPRVRPLAAPTAFVDRRETSFLTVVVAPGAADEGQFDFVVLGLGDFSGKVSFATAVSGSVRIHAATIAMFTPVGGGIARSGPLRMSRTLMPSAHAASISVTAANPSGTFQLVTARGDPVQAKAIVEQVIPAIEHADFNALFQLVAPEVRQGLSRRQFRARLAHATGPKVFSVVPSGGGRMVVLPSGYTSFIQPTTMKAHPSGGSVVTFGSRIVLILHVDRWYFLSNDPPPG